MVGETTSDICIEPRTSNHAGMHVSRIIVSSVGQLTTSGRYTAIASVRTIDISSITTPEPFGGGTWALGGFTGIYPGTYRVTSTEYCYWQRLSGNLPSAPGGDVDDVIAAYQANGLYGQLIVEIKSTDAGFYSHSDCGRWQPVNVSTLSSVNSFANGVWAVGSQITPGTWTASSDDCYWTRLSGFGGEFEDVIDADYSSSGNQIVQILDTDVGFNSQGCGTWVPN